MRFVAISPCSHALAVRTAFVIATVFCSPKAFAGPPFRTDDPEPVEYQHVETYFYSTGAHIDGENSGAPLAIDFNYGAVENLHLHIGPSSAYDATPGAKLRFGLGDTELGAKYRFLDDDKTGATPMAAFYPVLELPTGDQKRGLGEGYFRAFLPIWIEKNFPNWLTYGGGGYWFNESQRSGGRNYVYAGWTLQRKVTSNLSLGGELFYQGAGSVELPTNRPSPDSLGFNLGGIYDFDDHDHLLFSAGRGLLHAQQTNQFSSYIAWQLTY
jgi:hypothetical protein